MPARCLARAASILGLSLAVGGCGAATTKAKGAPGASAAPAPAFGGPDTDYVAVGPRALLAAIEPLLAHREALGHKVARVALEALPAPGARGLPAPEQIAQVIATIAAQAGGRLRFVLLVGDAPGMDEEGDPSASFVPTFYKPKVRYRERREEDLFFEPRYARLFDPQMLRFHEEIYPTDMPYGRVPSGGPLAVGRVPARVAEEARAFARKVVAYETARTEGAWRRGIALFSGPANFGAFADFLVESTTTRILDDDVSYDWDLDIVVPKLGSPYAVPFPQLREHLVDRLSAGALIAGYVGHGGPRRFDHVRHGYRFYEIGTAFDLARVRIPEGKPFFVSITCSTGYFDLSFGERSVAETLVLNPEGAIAAFASSRDSHPYPNALLGDAIVKTFIGERAPTIGEGVVTVKRRMREGSLPLVPLLFSSDPAELAEEHEGLYNLLGDPATRLRYPASAVVSFEGGAATREPGADAVIAVRVKEIVTGKATLTVETKRSVVRADVPSASALRAMPEEEAWDAMRKSYHAASNKVVARAEAPIQEGRARFTVKLPADEGDYAIKVHAAGGGEAAAGHVKVKVRKASPEPSGADQAGRAAHPGTDNVR